ncbi:uncharacterized protein LOC112970633 isoform X2 [Apteryx rowi]|uniref:uncharacterized protein LOC112970633 isoform X2 n=1 Tax=Apteryx rowi TaxID=308060 RepID=UPI000E1D05EE|nr:uncharacterized protein LOC112970633 isoform X2 [Apteryx rowi]
MALLLSCAALVLLLLLAFPQEALRCRESKVILVTEGEPISIACPFHEHCGTEDTFYEIIWSYEKDSRRILQFRTTPPKNTSIVLRNEGHFSGQLDFRRRMSFLNISEVLINDTGRYLCYVKVGHSSPSTEVTHLLIRGQQRSAASEGLRCSAPRGSKVILDCDFTTNVTGNFTELFWLHEREESPPRLIAWHHESSCPDGNSTGNRFQSSLDLENHRSRLTISGLQESDSGWYQCERLGESSGRQRGRGTNLTVKGSLTVLLVASGSAGFALAASCLYFLCCSNRALRPLCSAFNRHHACVRSLDTSPETPDPLSGPTEECAREPADREATYAGLSSEYSLLTFPGRSPSAGCQGQS